LKGTYSRDGLVLHVHNFPWFVQNIKFKKIRFVKLANGSTNALTRANAI